MKRILTPQSKIVLAVVALVFTVGLGAGVAWADSPHFIFANASLQGSNLLCSFKEAGLGTNQQIDYECTADGTAVYVCVNNGGANPSAKNKTTVSGPVSATGTFNSGKNGQVTQSLTVGPPSAGSFSCPSGQSLEVASVTYSNIDVADTTNNITEAAATGTADGVLSTGCLLPGVRGAC
jgi:hypothetical protein